MSQCDKGIIGIFIHNSGSIEMQNEKELYHRDAVKTQNKRNTNPQTRKKEKML